MQIGDRADEEAPGKARQLWLSRAHIRYRGNRNTTFYFSTHGLLLQFDLERAFVAGAWGSVIVLAQSVIEATLRHVQLRDYDIKAKALFKGNRRLERIRTLRNELVHPSPPGSASLVWRVENGDYVACHALLEQDAKRAVEYMLYVVYSSNNDLHRVNHGA